jgi:hypothetical protein
LLEKNHPTQSSTHPYPHSHKPHPSGKLDFLNGFTEMAKALKEKGVAPNCQYSLKTTIADIDVVYPDDLCTCRPLGGPDALW